MWPFLNFLFSFKQSNLMLRALQDSKVYQDHADHRVYAKSIDV